MRTVRYIVLALLITLSGSSAARAQEASVESQYPVISAYIYNFTQFTTWPAGAINAEFSVCVLGRNPFGSALAPLRTRSVDGKPITTKLFQRMSEDVLTCNVLFVSESERENVGEIVKALKGAPVLTVSNMDDFVDMGGMVELVKTDSRVGIKIGLRSVESSHISISSKLLRLANTTE